MRPEAGRRRLQPAGAVPVGVDAQRERGGVVHPIAAALASFCHYAGMREAGPPAEVRPKCELTGERARLPADATPLQGNARVVVFGDGNASAPTTVNCFVAQGPSDRLCITTAFYASIDCVPDGERPTVLRALLAVGDADFRGRNSGRAREQCFHRQGTADAGLHLHSFDGRRLDLPADAHRARRAAQPAAAQIACSDGGADDRGAPSSRTDGGGAARRRTRTATATDEGLEVWHMVSRRVHLYL